MGLQCGLSSSGSGANIIITSGHFQNTVDPYNDACITASGGGQVALAAGSAAYPTGSATPYANTSQFINISTEKDVTVKTSTFYEISASALTSFGSLEAGYTTLPTAQTVTVTNTGSGSVTLNQPSATDYIIGTLSTTNLAPGESTTFTVQPKAGLSVGNHDATITVTGSIGANATVNASFAVTDTTTPDGTITIGTNGWDNFWNVGTSTLFCNSAQTVTITGSDNSGGVLAIRYYLSATALTFSQVIGLPSAVWQDYTGSFSVNPNNK